MNNSPILIVMLTCNDRTVENAREIFETCKDSKAVYWGMKEAPLPKDEMKALYRRMRECGKTTVLEVVEYDEDACLKGAEIACECGCDILMGTMYFDSVNRLCREHNIRYMPFVGEVYDRPSVLEGEIGSMIETAKGYLEKGVFGIDLLGYRYIGCAETLNERMVRELGAPVCVAGSVNSFERLDEIKRISPWAFTIGGAFFEHAFGGEFCDQIDAVCDCIEK